MAEVMLRPLQGVGLPPFHFPFSDFAGTRPRRTLPQAAYKGACTSAALATSLCTAPRRNILITTLVPTHTQRSDEER